jgi:hypothetical protein
VRLDQEINGGITLILMLKKYNVRAQTGLIWLRIGTGGRLGNESSGVIKCGELLD